VVKPEASYSGGVRVREQVSRSCSQPKLTTIDLFSGIGGFALGLEATGHFETTQFVEMDKFCQKILTKRFKGVPIHEDVKTYNPPTADVVVGGFPCQGFSVAGKRKGTSDDRYLWPEMLRVIREAKPRWVIGENVRGIINIEDGMVFKQVHSDLEEEGFQTKCFVLPAASVNAPHQRYRTFFIGHNVANTKCNSSGEPIREIKDSKEEDEEQIRQNNSSTRESSRASSVRLSDKGYQNLADSTSIGLQEHGHIKSEDAIIGSEAVSNTDTGHLTQEEEVLPRWDAIEHESWWEFEPNVGRVADGIPSRAHRLRSLGNAVVPQVVYQIGKAIVVAEGLDKE